MRTLTVLLAGLFTTSAALAGPWLDPGDSGVRHDIQVLADAGVIGAPVSTWPLSWGDLQDALDTSASDLRPAELAAVARLQQRLSEAMITDKIILRSHVSLAENPRQIRTFENGPREDAEIGIGAEWTGNWLAARLEGQWVDDPDDNKDIRADNSYVGIALGNWLLAASISDRYWGPSWQSSMIQSNNARPVPAITLERNLTTPFKTKWLSWLGSWDLATFVGFLESGRAVPEAQQFALRFNFRPLRSLEIGISRSALWCGDNRDCGFGDFTDLLFGSGGLNESDQLGGFDLRWSPMLFGLPIAVYTHWIGEDFGDGVLREVLPSKWVGQFGGEIWGYWDRLGSYRFYLEWADTECDFSFYLTLKGDNDGGDPGCAYRNIDYRSGQTYRGRVFANSLDQDSGVWSFGGVLNRDNDHSWLVTVSVGKLNRRGINLSTTATNQTRYREIEVVHSRDLWIGELDVGLGYDYRDDTVADEEDDDFRAFVRWGFTY